MQLSYISSEILIQFTKQQRPFLLNQMKRIHERYLTLNVKEYRIYNKSVGYPENKIKTEVMISLDIILISRTYEKSQYRKSKLN